MIKKQVVILALILILMVTGIGIVSAETLTGTIVGSNFTQTTITQSSASSSTAYKVNGLYVNTFENTGNLKSIVMFSKHPATAFSTDVGAPSGSSTPVTIRISNQTLNATTHTHTKTDGRIVGTGTFGYQKVFTTATPPVEVPAGGYMWLAMDTWDLGTETGVQWLYMEYDAGAIYNATYGYYAGTSVTIPAGFATFSVSQGTTTLAGDAAGPSQMNLKDNSISASYNISKPAGVGIMGSIGKSVGGQNFTSQALVYGANGAIVTSESTLTPNTFNFSVTSAQVILGIKDSSGNKYNTSLLFSPAPTPTPTPTPIVTLNPGEFWLTFSAEDATTGGLIPGAEIDIYSEFTGTWNNATTSSGERTIATSQGHVYDAYGSATGYVNGSALDKIAYPNQNYLVKLFPSSGLPNVPGYVNLFVSVTERETGSPISGVSVTVSTPGSYTVNGETDNTGSEVFSTSNSSVKYITVSKSGYKSETRIITTPESGNYNAVLQMSRIVVTTVPTGYIPPGGVTPVTTMDSRSTTEKDTDMMNLIRDSGPNLIQLAIAVTMISLLGLMTRGFGK